MKKTIVSSLVLSLIPGLCLGVNDRIYKLIQEKQQKMEKLEKCQGTTKNLKIAGISTLGITAVGIGANIAEAVVLDKAKDQVKDAKNARDVQLQIKEDRIQREQQDHQLFVNLCNSFGGNLLENQTACNVVKKEFADYESSVFAARQSGGKCQASMDTEKSKITECEYPNKHILSIGWFWSADKQQNSGQAGNGNQQGNGGKDGKQGDVETAPKDGNKSAQTPSSEKDNGAQGGNQGGQQGDAKKSPSDGKGGNAQGNKQGGQQGDAKKSPSDGKGGQQGGAEPAPKGGNNPAQTPSGGNGNGNQNGNQGGNQGGQQGGESDNNNDSQGNQGDKKIDDEIVPAKELPNDGSVVVTKCRTAWGESHLNKTANVWNCNNDRSYVDIPLDNAKSDLKEFYDAIGCELAFKPTLMGNGIIYTDCAKNTVSGNDYISIIYSSLTCPYGYTLNEGAVQCDKVDVAPDMFANACNVISGAIKGKACQKEIYPTTEDDYAQAVEQLKSHESTLSGSDYGFDCKIEGDNTALSCTKGSYEIMEWVRDNKINCGDNTFNPVTGKCEATSNDTNKQEYKTYNYDCDIRIKAEYGDIMEGLQKCNDGKGFRGGYNYEHVGDNQWKQTIDEEKTIRIWTLRNLYCDDNYALVKGLCKEMSANAIAKQKEIDEANKQMDVEFDAIEKEIEQNSDPKTVCEKVGGGQYTVYGSPLKSGNAYLSYCNNINEAKCNEVIKKYTGTYGHFEWKEETFFTGGYKQNEYLSYEPNPDTVVTKCWFYNK